MASGERTYFLADMHLKPLDATRRRAREEAVRDNETLARFLSYIEGKAKTLVLLGDTFNFWVERRSHVVGDYFTALSLFKVAAEHGLDIHHVSGNRDFVVGEGLGFEATTRYPGFLKLKRGFTVSRMADFGIEPHGPRFRLHQGGKTIMCVHGDALCKRDRLFMMLRWLLQGRIGRTFWRWAPWAIVEWLVRGQQTRTTIRNGPGRSGELFDEASVRREMAMVGADLLLCGHIHARYEREVEAAGKIGRLIAIPPWLDRWYGVLEEGELRIERFED